MTSHIRIEHHGAVGVLTIARRDRFNSLDVETAQDFRKAGLQLARDRNVRAEAPTAAVGAAKRLLNRAAGMDRLDVHLDAELSELARIADGDNFAEVLAAFFERRPPRFGAE
jgi:enoyl-CoA hydratase/carnithine racemase